MRALALVAIIVLSGCLGGAEGPGPLPPQEPAPRESLHFLAIGDMGTGQEAQYAVAAAMETVCAQLGCDMVIGLGDNIYETGVTSVFDPQFESKFEQPYANLTMPFYMTLGNHDYGTQTAVAVQDGADRARFQIEYSSRTNRTSQKWHMPDHYYVVHTPHATFFALDTNHLSLAGAPHPTDPGGVAQGEWFDRVVAEADTPWTFTFGHHPFISNGDHDDAGGFQTDPLPFIPADTDENFEHWFRSHVCDKVDFHVSGHDHDLQWLHATQLCGQTEFIVSGAAAKTREITTPGRNEARFELGNTYGFFWGNVTADRFEGRFYDANATLLFTHAVDR